jgi:hypothetical protein
MTEGLANDDPQFAFNFADIPDDTRKDEGPKVKRVEWTKKEAHRTRHRSVIKNGHHQDASPEGGY